MCRIFKLSSKKPSDYASLYQVQETQSLVGKRLVSIMAGNTRIFQKMFSDAIIRSQLPLLLLLCRQFELCFKALVDTV